jgi:phenylalanyl-tRNA synthetase alpha chain
MFCPILFILTSGLIQCAEEEAGGRAVLEQEYPLLSQLLSQEPRAEAFQVPLRVDASVRKVAHAPAPAAIARSVPQMAGTVDLPVGPSGVQEALEAPAIAPEAAPKSDAGQAFLAPPLSGFHLPAAPSLGVAMPAVFLVMLVGAAVAPSRTRQSHAEPEVNCGPNGPLFDSASSALLAAAKEHAKGKPRARAPRMVATVDSPYITGEVGNNVTPYIANLVGRDLHRTADHPLGIIKAKIEEYFATLGDFEIEDTLQPVVSAEACFDDLLIPFDHPGRKPSDTYYISRPGGREESSSADKLLRTHTSAHQSQLLRAGKEKFLCTGDVYRRDEIDASHFPAFHQMEGVKLFDPAEVGGAMTREEWLASEGAQVVAADLKKTLEGLCDHLFGPVEKRWIDEYFPFTEPSFELEIFYNGDWMEVLGCGVIHSGVLEKCGLQDRHGWAFGLGLERLAMVLFSIPDIRLFWSDDKRFKKQFSAGKIQAFKPYSKYPPCYKDIAFWLPPTFEPNDFFELGREVCGELVEKMELIDEFANPKTGKTSNCYRVTYRSMDRSLTDEEVNKMQEELRERAGELGVELR